MLKRIKDWSQYENCDISTITDVDIYCQVLLKQNKVELLEESFKDPLKNQAMGKLLQYKEYRENLFKDTDKNTLIKILESPITRSFAYNYLINSAEKNENIQELALEILKNPGKYPWSLKDQFGFISLLSKDILKTILSSRIPSDSQLFSNTKDTDRIFLYMDKKFHFSNMQPNSSVQKYTFGKEFFQRDDFLNLIVEVTQEIGNFLIEKDNAKRYASCIDTLLNKELFDYLYTFTTEKKAKEIKEKSFKGFNFAKIFKKSIIDMYFGNIPLLYMTQEECFSTFTDILLEDLQKQKRSKIAKLVNIFLSSLGRSNEKKTSLLLFSLKCIPIESPESEKAKIWNGFVEKCAEIAADQFINSDYSPLFTRVLQDIYIEKNDSYDNGRLYFSYDESMLIINKVISEVLNLKEKLKNENFESYNKHVCILLIYLLTATEERFPNDSIFDRVYMNVLDTWRTPFEFLPQDLRDKLIIEAIRHPQNESQFAPWITSRLSNVLLGMFIKFSSVSCMKLLLPENRRDAADKYGFMDYSITYPPLYSDSKKKSSTVTEKMSLFEIFLHKSKWIESKNSKFFQSGFNSYKYFMEKILFEGYKTKDKTLQEYAISVYKRLCRLLLSETMQIHTRYQLTTVTAVVINPLALQIGYSLDENFPHYVCDNFIKHIPIDSAYMQFPHNQIIGQLLSASCIKEFPDLDKISCILLDFILTNDSKEMNYRHPPPIPIAHSQLQKINNSDYISYSKKVINARSSVLPLKQARIGEYTKTQSFAFPPLPIDTYIDKYDVDDKIDMKPGMLTYLKAVDFVYNNIISGYNNKMMKASEPIYGKEFKPLYLNQLVSSFVIQMTKAISSINIFDETEYITIKTQFYGDQFHNCTFSWNITQASVSFLRNFISKDSNINPILNYEPEVLNKIKLINYISHIDLQNTPFSMPNDVDLQEIKYTYKLIVNKPMIDSYNSSIEYWREIQQQQKQQFDAYFNSNIQVKGAIDSYNFLKSIEIPDEFIQFDFVTTIPTTHEEIESKQEMRTYKTVKYSYPLDERVINSLLNIDINEFMQNEKPQSEEIKLFINTLNSFQCGIDFKGKKTTIIARIIGKLLEELIKPPSNKATYSYQANNLLQQLVSSLLSSKHFFKTFEIDEISSIIKKLSLLTEKEVFQNRSSSDISCTSTIMNFFNKCFYKQNDKIIFEVFNSFLFGQHSNFMFVYKENKKDKFMQYINRIIETIMQKNLSADHHVINQILSVLFNPIITGEFPVKSNSLDFIKFLASSKLYNKVEIKYSIISSLIAYIQYQSIIHSEPTQIDEIFEVLQTIYNKDQNATTTLLLSILNPQSTINTMQSIPFYNGMINEIQNASNFYIKFFPDHVLQLPETDSYEKIYEYIVSNFIFQSLSSKNTNLVELVISLLPELKYTIGDLAAKIAPFITDAIMKYEPSQKTSLIITYGLTFVQKYSNKQYVDPIIKSFSSLFESLISKLNLHSLDYLKKLIQNQNTSKPISNNFIVSIENIFVEMVRSVSDFILNSINSHQWIDCCNSSSICRILLDLLKEKTINIKNKNVEEFSYLLEFIGCNSFEKLFDILSKQEDKEESNSSSIDNPLALSEALNLFEEKYQIIPRFDYLFRSIYDIVSNSFNYNHVKQVMNWNPEIFTKCSMIVELLSKNIVKNIPKDLPDSEFIEVSSKLSPFLLLYGNLYMTRANPLSNLMYSSRLNNDRGPIFSALSNTFVPTQEARRLQNPNYSAMCQRIAPSNEVNRYQYDNVLYECDADEEKEKAETQNIDNYNDAVDDEEMAETQNDELFEVFNLI